MYLYRDNNMMKDAVPAKVIIFGKYNQFCTKSEKFLGEFLVIAFDHNEIKMCSAIHKDKSGTC